ncbi:PASTA domain-containing protein [Capnocytophaga haemolytica]|uniref:Penicillin-binding protein n=1 Tax=Capnocytophaga haemolytica TaxID=45243 RepID=A0AAX2GY36_9FLAO|nr:PASTA domain-containing protein [Capnocytophaga haemolytica]AMD84436.1 penicillin-binding protein [Capnocytophaga haemolytica]SFO09674.1 PASTA domain-containing protein [Capnocytophaga haemolytica]SNV10566.1 Serine/threonine-protein kinase PrkC [Capnocytophaga haemolytica]
MKEKLKTFFRRFGKHIALAIVATIVLIWLALKLLQVYTAHGKFIVVPDLTRKTLTEVQIILDEQNLRFEVLDSTEYDPKFPAFSVISQSPEANERVKKNRKIYLTINPSGYHKVTVPKVIQVTRRNAIATLESVGLTVGRVTYVDNIGKDMVLEMQYNGKPVQPGDKLVKTSRIDLVCGNGFEHSRDSVQEQGVIPVEDLME